MNTGGRGVEKNETNKLHIGGVDSDDQRCLRCGSMFLDTGWECTDCGYDNMPHYYSPTDRIPPTGGTQA